MGEGKDEKQQKMMNPMFPRLHVNDKEKGGPRAPPRNKMALYEQLSIPSQRSGHGSVSILPLPPSIGNGGIQQRSNNAFTPLHNPPASSLSEKRQIHPFSRFGFGSAVETPQPNQPSNSLSVKSNSFQHQTSDFRKPLRRKPVGSEDRTSPLPSQSRLSNPSELGATESVDLESRYRIRDKIHEKGHETMQSAEKLKRQHKDCSAEADGRNSSKNEKGSKRQKTASSASCLSPDDVVGIIGQKQFWLARKAIANQQRDFSVQVFELHRILKVQNLIARSPEILFEETLFFRKPTAKPDPIPSNKTPRESKDNQDPQRLEQLLPSNKTPTESKANDYPQTLARHSHSATERHHQRLEQLPEAANHITETTATPPISNIESTKEPVSPLQNQLENPPETAEAKSDMWCFPPSGNQWLVPVVSPSEGLIYKPYAGPGPPNAGFLGPVYGGCGPIKMNFPSPMGPTYFPPYGMPMMNSPVPNPFSDSWLYGRESQLSEQVSQVDPRKVPGAKGREMEGSTGSCPSERPCRRGGPTVPLPLFPTSPTSTPAASNPTASNPTASQSTERRTKVIKVVPHNPKLATETAARIFRSIQEERKQCD